MSKPLDARQYADSKGAIIYGFDGNILFASGTAAPSNGVEGYSAGAIYLRAGQAADTQFYINVGSASSASWTAFTTSVILGLSGLTATATEINAVADFPADAAVTATADGLTTGLIPATAKTVLATSASADNIITLPGIAANSLGIGHTIRGRIAATGCEIRTPATLGETINGVDADGSQEAALAANHGFIATVISATGWMLIDGAATVPD